MDTASPQGKFTLQVLGAAVEFERALIRERTKAGLEGARSQAGSAAIPACVPAIRPRCARCASPDTTATWSD